MQTPLIAGIERNQQRRHLIIKILDATFNEYRKDTLEEISNDGTE